MKEGGLRFIVHAPRGTISIIDQKGRAVLPQFWLEFETMDGTSYITCQSGFVRRGQSWSCDLAGGKIRLDLALERPPRRGETSPVSRAGPPKSSGLILNASIHNLGVEPLALKSTRMMRARIPAGSALWGDPGTWKILKMGYTFGGAHREEEDPRNSALVTLAGRRDSVRSWGMAAVKTVHGQSGIILGFTTGKRQMSWIDVSRDGNEADISAVGEADGIVVPPGGSLALETLYAGLHADLLEGLASFGKLAGAGMKAAHKPAPSGWCSWHYYRDRGIGERTVLENADFIRDRRKELPFDVIQLDDGYQKAYGDWLEHGDRFPHGVEWLAGEVARRGLVPGIWVAPFTLHARSKMAKEHPDWLVKDLTGKPLTWEMPWAKAGDAWHALDAGHPEAQAWLSILFGRLYTAGFRYFKLDFLFMGAVKGARSRPGTRVEAFRAGLAAIRAAVRNSYVLACTAPYLPCAGLVDGIRTSHDINPGGKPLESFLEAARETTQRFWAHGNLWNTDPDAVILRPEPGMPAPASGAVAAAALLSGGGIFSGDALPVMGIDRLNILSGLLKNRRPQAGIPLDLFESERPRFVSQPLGGGRFRLGIFNFSKDRRTVSFDLSRLGLKTASVGSLPGFGPAMSGKVRGRLLTPPLPPGGAIVLVIKG